MTRTAVACAQGLSGAQVQCLSGVIRRSGPAARRTDTRRHVRSADSASAR